MCEHKAYVLSKFMSWRIHSIFQRKYLGFLQREWYLGYKYVNGTQKETENGKWQKGCRLLILTYVWRHEGDFKRTQYVSFLYIFTRLTWIWECPFYIPDCPQSAQHRATTSSFVTPFVLNSPPFPWHRIRILIISKLGIYTQIDGYFPHQWGIFS